MEKIFSRFYFISTKYEMHFKILKRILYFSLPILTFYIVLIGKHTIKNITGLFPSCMFHELFHKYCPACGNTRSVLYLIDGDILSSLRFNIVPIFLLLICTAFYIEGAFYIFGKRVIIVPRSNALLLWTTLGFLLYFVIRNFVPYLTPIF